MMLGASVNVNPKEGGSPLFSVKAKAPAKNRCFHITTQTEEKGTIRMCGVINI
jgi:hypothetical protein